MPHEQRGLKNKSSRRRVPLHSKMVEAGFTTWAQGAQAREAQRDGRDALATLGAQGTSRLFGGTSSASGKRYRRWARKLVPDTRKVFHSWRHMVITLLREAGVPVE